MKRLNDINKELKDKKDDEKKLQKRKREKKKDEIVGENEITGRRRIARKNR